MDYDNIEIMRRWTLLDLYSFFNAVFFCSLFSVVLWLLCRKTSWMVRLGLKPLCLFVFLAVLRLVIPIELPFVQIVGSRKILVWVQRGFRIRLAQLGGHSIETGDVFLFVWLWGAALLLGRFLWQWARHGRFMAQCPSIPQEMMEQVRSWIPGFRGQVRLAAGQGTPYVVGFFRPVIFLPDADYKEQDLHLILLHEWQHFRNRDQWSKLLCYLLCCVFWWNPFLWLLKNKMDQLLELRCDFSVLEKIDTVQQDDYYEMLLGTYRAAREKHSMPEGIAALASSHRHVILQRFQMGGHFSRMEKQSKVERRILMGLMTAAFIGSYLVIFQPQGFPPPVEDGHRIYSGPPEGSYLIRHADGTYSLYLDGNITSVKDITKEPFASLPVREEGDQQ